MTFGNQWKKFIQVNIYGQTLRELERQGVVLETVLSNVGCSKLWIVEGAMYSDENSPDYSTISESSSADDSTVIAPPLSTTMAEVKCPRFSTPIQSQANLQRQFTLNLPGKISEINSSNEDEIVIEESISLDVEHMLNKMIQKVVEEQERKEILSTTIMKVNVPRYSTPIQPEDVFTLDITENLSAIDTDDDDVVVSDQEEEPSLRKPKTTSRSVSAVSPLKRRRSRRLSGPLLKTEIRELLVEPKKMRSMLTRSTTERKPSQRITVKSSISVDPKIPDTENHEDTIQESFQSFSSPTSGPVVPESRCVELKPVVRFSGTEFDFDGPSTSAQAAAASGVAEDPMNDHYQDISYDMDYGDDNNYNEHRSEETGAANYFSMSDNDDTDLIEEIVEQETALKHTPPPPHLISTTKSILRSGGSVKPKKTVSFGVPRNKMSEKQKKLDETHNISCQFDGCGKKFAWKIRYGKQRLLDHVMNHLDDKCIVCRMCEQTFSTSRQIHYHYRRTHPEVKCSTFKILDVFNMEMDDFSVTDLFKQCFKPQLPIIGKIGKIRNSRRKHQLKQKKDGDKNQGDRKEDGDDEMADDDDQRAALNASSLF